MDFVVIVLYVLFLTFIFWYSISQLALTFSFIKRDKKNNSKELTNFPLVTVQLPIYNEKYVIERLINAIANFDYPKDKLEIQVLDDSNDETVEIVALITQQLSQKGIDIKHIVRENKSEFKAGALKYGTNLAKGEFIAIFDADFVPPKDFLLRTIPFFEDKEIGVVQTRWGHLNENYSVLTKLQAYALNAHFTVEQAGRNSNDYFINFNGTAGIWRKEAITTSGGWQGDTLTEDIDLSYRAQLKGWKFKYLEDLVCPAELPPEMNSLKSQQYRWAKGAAECTKKNLIKVLKRNDYSVSKKIAAICHLTNSFMWVCLFFSALLLMPFLMIINSTSAFNNFIAILFIYQFTFVLLFIFYVTANFYAGIKSTKEILTFVLLYPVFLSVMMGIALNNAIGTIKGYLKIKSPFVRTPKLNIVNTTDEIKGKSYVKFNFSFTTLLEILSLSYFIYATFYTYNIGNFSAFMFMLMITGGTLLMLSFSLLHYLKARRIA